MVTYYLITYRGRVLGRTAHLFSTYHPERARRLINRHYPDYPHAQIIRDPDQESTQVGRFTLSTDRDLVKLRKDLGRALRRFPPGVLHTLIDDLARVAPTPQPIASSPQPTPNDLESLDDLIAGDGSTPPNSPAPT